MLLPEFQSLRRDFDHQASRYSDLTLTIYFIESGASPEPILFRKPNHATVLWQYMGNITGQASIDEIVQFDVTKYGATGAKLSAFAVVEGTDTELFRRMAYRAGSIVPEDVREDIYTSLCSPWEAQPGKPVVSVNSDPLAVWLRTTLSCIATYQPERLRGSTLAVDPFAASVIACDVVIRQIMRRANKRVANSKRTGLTAQKFQVALSFPGGRRDYVAQVADGLRMSGISVFFDAYFKPELAQPDLDVLLQTIYHDNSQLIVVFLCREYDTKEWCGLEWRSLRDLIKKKRGPAIMPLRFDDTEIAGLFSIDGYIDIRDTTAGEVVEFIRQRLLAGP